MVSNSREFRLKKTRTTMIIARTIAAGQSNFRRRLVPLISFFSRFPSVIFSDFQLFLQIISQLASDVKNVRVPTTGNLLLETLHTRSGGPGLVPEAKPAFYAEVKTKHVPKK
jgi:hypothetical protein